MPSSLQSLTLVSCSAKAELGLLVDARHVAEGCLPGPQCVVPANQSMEPRQKAALQRFSAVSHEVGVARCALPGILLAPEEHSSCILMVYQVTRGFSLPAKTKLLHSLRTAVSLQCRLTHPLLVQSQRRDMKLHFSTNNSRKSWQSANFLCMPLEVN